MLEIDGVRTAISRGPGYGFADEVADSYRSLLDYATAGVQTEKTRFHAAIERNFIEGNDAYIHRRLRDAEGIPGLVGVTAAYESAMEQVAVLLDNRGEV